MDETRIEAIVRDALRAHAEDSSLPGLSSTSVVKRARRRLLRNGVGLVVVTVLTAVIGLRAVAGADRSSPVTSPKPVGLRGDGKIAFTGFGVDNGLYLIDPSGKGQVRIAKACSGQTCGIDRAAWSPSGGELVFTYYSEKGPLGPEFGPLHLIRPDGSGLRSITGCIWPACHDSAPAWSPDGSKISFVRYGGIRGRTGKGVLCVIAADGSHLTRLSRPGVSPMTATWSPDGGRLAYTADYGVGRTRLVVTTADGSRSSILVDGAAAGDPYSPAWSPDGSKLAYSRNSIRSDVGELWVIGADGSDPHRILRSQGLGAPVWSQGQGAPVWSPDGARLAVVANGSLLAMNADGTGQVVLMSGVISSSPVWSPSGTKLACIADSHLVVVSADGSGQRILRPVENGGMVAWQPVAG